MEFPNRSLDIRIEYNPPISGCADGVTAAEIFTADLTSDQNEELIERITKTVKAFHLENGLGWTD